MDRRDQAGRYGRRRKPGFDLENISETNFQPADIVLGQPDFTTDVINNNGSNSTGSPSAKNMNMPYDGVFSNGTQLFVDDQKNQRILIWNTFPTSSFQAADVVLGQPNFSCGVANNDGTGCIGGSPSANNLSEPYRHRTNRQSAYRSRRRQQSIPDLQRPVGHSLNGSPLLGPRRRASCALVDLDQNANIGSLAAIASENRLCRWRNQSMLVRISAVKIASAARGNARRIGGSLCRRT